MTKERFIELQTEIAKLKEIDRKTTNRVRATYSIKDKAIDRMNVDCFEIPCSLELDMEWANESENI